MEVKDREDKDIRQPDLKSMNMEELRNWVTGCRSAGIQGEADISVVSCEACGRNGGDDQSAEKPQREYG